MDEHAQLGLLEAARQTQVPLFAVTPSCRIVEANPAAQLLSRDLLGHRFCEVFQETPCDAGGAACRFAAALTGKERRSAFRQATISIGERQQMALVAAQTVTDAEINAPLGAQITLIPSTLINEIDRKRRKLLDDVVHDLRHPVTVQKLLVDLLVEQAAECPPMVRQTILNLHRQMGFIDIMLDEVVNCAHFDLDGIVVQDRSVALRALLEQVVLQLRPLFDRKRQTVRLRVSKDLTIWADPLWFERAIINLLVNAHKYSVVGDQVVLAARRNARRSAVEITVRDHGPGIPSAERRHVFTRYFRGTSAGAQRGSGIGLAIAQTIVRQHGGGITVHQAPGGGALFRLWFPDAPSHETAVRCAQPDLAACNHLPEVRQLEASLACGQ